MKTPEEIEELVLTRVRVGLGTAIGRHVLDSLHADVELERVFDRLAVRLRAELLTEQLPTERIIREATKRIPASPWQAWKAAHLHARWYPRRLLRPVRYQTYGLEVTVDVGRFRAFPGADFAPLPGLGNAVRIVRPNVSLREWTDPYPDLLDF